jgi:hypothetical protein
MRATMRHTAPYLTVLIALLLAAGTACAQTVWPNLVSYAVSLSSDAATRYQASLALSGPVGENLGAKLEGWWTGGGDDDQAFVGDAYLDYDRGALYLAAGRKYVTFRQPESPVGVLVSSGILGGEAQVRAGRVTFHGIVGGLAFMPGTSTTGFTFAGMPPGVCAGGSCGPTIPVAGRRGSAPLEEDILALRATGQLTAPGAVTPVALGVNWIDVAEETGGSIDASIGVTKWLTLYGEAARCGEDAQVYGLRLSDMELRTDGKATFLVWYHRDIDEGFVPAAVGATSFFEGQRGWVGGLYHQISPYRSLGAFADGDEVVLTLFGNRPL